MLLYKLTFIFFFPPPQRKMGHRKIAYFRDEVEATSKNLRALIWSPVMLNYLNVMLFVLFLNFTNKLSIIGPSIILFVVPLTAAGALDLFESFSWTTWWKEQVCKLGSIPVPYDSTCSICKLFNRTFISIQHHSICVAQLATFSLLWDLPSKPWPWADGPKPLPLNTNCCPYNICHCRL